MWCGADVAERAPDSIILFSPRQEFANIHVFLCFFKSPIRNGQKNSSLNIFTLPDCFYLILGSGGELVCVPLRYSTGYIALVSAGERWLSGYVELLVEPYADCRELKESPIFAVLCVKSFVVLVVCRFMS